MKDVERERPSEVEERKFIWEHVRPLTAKLPQRIPPMKLKGLQPGTSGEEVVWALATQNSYDARQMPDTYVEDEHYFYVWCKGFSQIGEIINKNTYECSAWTTEKGSPRLFIE